MTWFSRLFPGHSAQLQALTSGQQQAVAAWQQLPAADLRRSHYRCRYVLVDVEASLGSAPAEAPAAVAAVAVVDGRIDFRDAFEVTLVDPERRAPAAGGQTERRAGEESGGIGASDALVALIRFIGKAPLVSYNVSLVAPAVEGILARSLGVDLGLPWIDLAWLMPDLFRDVEPAGGLDAWLAHFGIDVIRRHDALSDAFAMAQLLQVALARAARKGFETPASLLDLERARRHMHQSA